MTANWANPGSGRPAGPPTRATADITSRGPRDLISGVAYLGRGIAWTARNPKFWLLGLVPALIATVLYVIALVALVSRLDDLAAAVTPFADDWAEVWRQIVRGAAMIAMFGVALLVVVVTFTAVTLVIGQPLYEHISERVEESVGGAPSPPDEPLWRQIARSARDGLLVAFYAGLIGAVLLVAEFIPVVGQTVIPVIGVTVSGFFLTAELTSIALERRGVRRRQRFALLRGRWWLVVGFGAVVWVSFLVPFGAVVLMPGAVAGATLMVRERLAVSAQL